jgi:PAS domain S-box-containing protein
MARDEIGRLTREDDTRIEAELRRSEAYLAEGERISRTGTWAVNPATGDVYWSQEVFRIYGLDPVTTTLSQEVAFQLIHPEDRTAVQQALETSLRDKSDYSVEHRAIVAGHTKYLHALGRPILNASGDLVEYIGSVVDVTERKLTELQLREANDRVQQLLEDSRESEKRFRLLAETIPQQVWSYRTDGTIDYFNRRWLAYTGLTREQAERTGGYDRLHPDDRQRVSTIWRDASVRGDPWEVEVRLLGRDGRYRRFLSRGTPLRSDAGVTMRWFATNTDIEDRQRAEESLRETQAALAHVMRLTTIGELMATLAHELNQPLAAALANGSAALRWLEHDVPNVDEAVRGVHRVLRDIIRTSDVIASVRNLLKKSVNERIGVDIATIIQDVLLSLDFEIVKYEIVIHQSLATDLPQPLGSKVELQQVLLNLIVNAIQSMADVSDRPRELTIACERREFYSGAGLFVAVQDTGVGLTSQTFRRLFESFYTTKPGGLGMGLAISRSIVQAHGGVLWAEPNAGHGSSFQFIVPA